MQTSHQTDPVNDSLATLYALDGEPFERVLRAVLGAVHEHEATGDPQVLVTMARDVAFTLRMQRSEGYRKLMHNGPREPTGKGRPVSDVLADLGM